MRVLGAVVVREKALTLTLSHRMGEGTDFSAFVLLNASNKTDESERSGGENCFSLSRRTGEGRGEGELIL